MAAPRQTPQEDAFRLRRFQGTNTMVDSTFLGPAILARSENWIPTQSRRIGKRPGTASMQRVLMGTVDVTDLLAAKTPTGQPILYAYCRRPPEPAGDAFIAVSIAEQPFGFDPPSAFFATSSAIGRMIRFRDRIYAGNGVDPLVSWKIDTAGTTLSFPAMGTLTGTVPTAVDNPSVNPGEAMGTGEFSYCWAIFNTTSGLYESRSDAATITLTAGSNGTGQRLRTVAPAPSLAAGLVYRFFIALRNFPIEYAMAQGPDYAAGEVREFTNLSVSQLRCPVKAGVFRTGNMFLVWRNRLVFAGMAANPYTVFATDVLLPGLEQQVYNQGTFFPVHAAVPLPDRVTGIGIAGVTTEHDAQAPLLFFTNNRTFVAMGDPFSATEAAELTEVSSRVGCVAHDSIVNTPHGTCFVGLDSIYLIPPGGGYPQDVGWPIADQVMGVPPGVYDRLVAIFHKGFYKVFLPPTGGAENTLSWWLDLREGLTSPPSWWGPHVLEDATGVDLGLSALATDPTSQQEPDRGYGVLSGTDHVVLLHQVGLFADLGLPVIARLRSGRFDADQPFVPKIFTRLRTITHGAGPGELEVSFVTDEGVRWSIDPIPLGADLESAQWQHGPLAFPRPLPPPNKAWRTAKWRSVTPMEAQTITPYTRPRGLSVEITLTHRTARSCELRDLEILFLWSERKVRYIAYPYNFRAGTQTRGFPPERISK